MLVASLVCLALIDTALLPRPRSSEDRREPEPELVLGIMASNVSASNDTRLATTTSPPPPAPPPQLPIAGADTGVSWLELVLLVVTLASCVLLAFVSYKEEMQQQREEAMEAKEEEERRSPRGSYGGSKGGLAGLAPPAAE